MHFNLAFIWIARLPPPNFNLHQKPLKIAIIVTIVTPPSPTPPSHKAKSFKLQFSVILLSNLLGIGV